MAAMRINFCTDSRAELSRMIARQCRVTRGTWCVKYKRQIPVRYKPPPRGSKQCPNECNKVGNCNHDTGLCECPAGEEEAPL